MKKLAFAVTAVLLAVLMSGCQFPVSGGNTAEYDEHGRQLVEVTIEMGEGSGARSILPEVVRDYASFFEVVVEVGGTNPYKRVTWFGEGAKPRIKIVPDDYTDKAVLFAGTPNRNLLAVGKLANPIVAANTTSITFELVAFDAKIDLDENDSAFQIQTGIASPGYIAIGQKDGDDVPVFEVIKNSGLEATYTLDLVKINDSYSSAWAAYNSLIKLRGDGMVNPIGMSLDGGIKPAVLDSGEFVGLTAGASLPKVLNLEMQTPDKDGVCMIVLEIPVAPLDPAATPTQWCIRPGISFYEVDDASADESKGGLNGAILLGIGEWDNSASGGIDIIIEYP